MRESTQYMMQYGVTQWERFDKDDRKTHPQWAHEIMLCVLSKEGKARIIKTAMFSFVGTFYEILGTRNMKGVAGGKTITKRKKLNIDDYQDIAWCEITCPDWWVSKDNGSTGK